MFENQEQKGPGKGCLAIFGIAVAVVILFIIWPSDSDWEPEKMTTVSGSSAAQGLSANWLLAKQAEKNRKCIE